jgi:hypothetical protein
MILSVRSRSFFNASLREVELASVTKNMLAGLVGFRAGRLTWIQNVLIEDGHMVEATGNDTSELHLENEGLFRMVTYLCLQ